VIITEDDVATLDDADLKRSINLLLRELDSRGGQLVVLPPEAAPNHGQRVWLSPGAEEALAALDAGTPTDPNPTLAIPRSAAQAALALQRERRALTLADAE
jgi:hypothetical protein